MQLNGKMTDESRKRKTDTDSVPLKHRVPRVCIICHAEKLGCAAERLRPDVVLEREVFSQEECKNYFKNAGYKNPQESRQNCDTL